MSGVSPALGLQLIAKITRKAASELERQIHRRQLRPLQLPAEVVEDRFPAQLHPAAPLDAHLSLVDVVGDLRAKWPAVIAHEGEAGTLASSRAIEPEGVLALAVQADERLLGIAPRVKPLHQKLR